MNATTKDALIDFATKVQILASGTIHMIGLEIAQEVIASAEVLKTALKKDETLGVL